MDFDQGSNGSHGGGPGSFDPFDIDGKFDSQGLPKSQRSHVLDKASTYEQKIFTRSLERANRKGSQVKNVDKSYQNKYPRAFADLKESYKIFTKKKIAEKRRQREYMQDMARRQQKSYEFYQQQMQQQYQYQGRQTDMGNFDDDMGETQYQNFNLGGPIAPGPGILKQSSFQNQNQIQNQQQSLSRTGSNVRATTMNHLRLTDGLNSMSIGDHSQIDLPRTPRGQAIGKMTSFGTASQENDYDYHVHHSIFNQIGQIQLNLMNQVSQGPRQTQGQSNLRMSSQSGNFNSSFLDPLASGHMGDQSQQSQQWQSNSQMTLPQNSMSMNFNQSQQLAPPVAGPGFDLKSPQSQGRRISFTIANSTQGPAGFLKGQQQSQQLSSFIPQLSPRSPRSPRQLFNSMNSQMSSQQQQMSMGPNLILDTGILAERERLLQKNKNVLDQAIYQLNPNSNDGNGDHQNGHGGRGKKSTKKFDQNQINPVTLNEQFTNGANLNGSIGNQSNMVNPFAMLGTHMIQPGFASMIQQQEIPRQTSFNNHNVNRFSQPGNTDNIGYGTGSQNMDFMSSSQFQNLNSGIGPEQNSMVHLMSPKSARDQISNMDTQSLFAMNRRQFINDQGVMKQSELAHYHDQMNLSTNNTPRGTRTVTSPKRGPPSGLQIDTANLANNDDSQSQSKTNVIQAWPPPPVTAEDQTVTVEEAPGSLPGTVAADSDDDQQSQRRKSDASSAGKGSNKSNKSSRKSGNNNIDTQQQIEIQVIQPQPSPSSKNNNQNLSQQSGIPASLLDHQVTMSRSQGNLQGWRRNSNFSNISGVSHATIQSQLSQQSEMNNSQSIQFSDNNQNDNQNQNNNIIIENINNRPSTVSGAQQQQYQIGPDGQPVGMRRTFLASRGTNRNSMLISNHTEQFFKGMGIQMPPGSFGPQIQQASGGNFLNVPESAGGGRLSGVGRTGGRLSFQSNVSNMSQSQMSNLSSVGGGNTKKGKKKSQRLSRRKSAQKEASGSVQENNNQQSSGLKINIPSDSTDLNSANNLNQDQAQNTMSITVTDEHIIPDESQFSSFLPPVQNQNQQDSIPLVPPTPMFSTIGEQLDMLNKELKRKSRRSVGGVGGNLNNNNNNSSGPGQSTGLNLPDIGGGGAGSPTNTNGRVSLVQNQTSKDNLHRRLSNSNTSSKLLQLTTSGPGNSNLRQSTVSYQPKSQLMLRQYQESQTTVMPVNQQYGRQTLILDSDARNQINSAVDEDIDPNASDVDSVDLDGGVNRNIPSLQQGYGDKNSGIGKSLAQFGATGPGTYNKVLQKDSKNGSKVQIIEEDTTVQDAELIGGNGSGDLSLNNMVNQTSTNNMSSTNSIMSNQQSQTGISAASTLTVGSVQSLSQSAVRKSMTTGQGPLPGPLVASKSKKLSRRDSFTQVDDQGNVSIHTGNMIQKMDRRPSMAAGMLVSGRKPMGGGPIQSGKTPENEIQPNLIQNQIISQLQVIQQQQYYQQQPMSSLRPSTLNVNTNTLVTPNTVAQGQIGVVTRGSFRALSQQIQNTMPELLQNQNHNQNQNQKDLQSYQVSENKTRISLQSQAAAKVILEQMEQDKAQGQKALSQGQQTPGGTQQQISSPQAVQQAQPNLEVHLGKSALQMSALETVSAGAKMMFDTKAVDGRQAMEKLATLNQQQEQIMQQKGEMRMPLAIQSAAQQFQSIPLNNMNQNFNQIQNQNSILNQQLQSLKLNQNNFNTAIPTRQSEYNAIASRSSPLHSPISSKTRGTVMIQRQNTTGLEEDSYLGAVGDSIGLSGFQNINSNIEKGGSGPGIGGSGGPGGAGTSSTNHSNPKAFRRMNTVTIGGRHKTMTQDQIKQHMADTLAAKMETGTKIGRYQIL